jgi:hypothetical protein
MNAPIASPEPQTTYVRTAKSRYPVSGITLIDGKTVLIGRQPSGKARHLTRQDVGTARFYSALAHFQGQHPAS